MAQTSMPLARRADTEIFAEARHALDRSLDVPQTVRVHVIDGVVTLTGIVRLPHQRTQAAAAVRGIEGVQRLVNHIVATERPDADTLDVS